MKTYPKAVSTRGRSKGLKVGRCGELFCLFPHLQNGEKNSLLTVELISLVFEVMVMSTLHKEMYNFMVSGEFWWCTLTAGAHSGEGKKKYWTVVFYTIDLFLGSYSPHYCSMWTLQNLKYILPFNTPVRGREVPHFSDSLSLLQLPKWLAQHHTGSLWWSRELNLCLPSYHFKH